VVAETSSLWSFNLMLALESSEVLLLVNGKGRKRELEDTSATTEGVSVWPFPVFPPLPPEPAKRAAQSIACRSQVSSGPKTN